MKKDLIVLNSRNTSKKTIQVQDIQTKVIHFMIIISKTLPKIKFL